MRWPTAPSTAGFDAPVSCQRARIYDYARANFLLSVLGQTCLDAGYPVIIKYDISIRIADFVSCIRSEGIARTMAIKKTQDAYNLRLTGPGITIDRPLSEGLARKVTALVMGGGGNSEGLGSGEESRAGEEDGSANVSPKAFMTAKRPSTDMERITCLAFYLTHTKRMTPFKTRDLIDLNIAAAQPKMSNASVAARNAVQNEYLWLAGGGKKQITARGEAVVQALPDRDKVKKALEIHRLRKRRKSRKAGKAKKPRHTAKGA